MIRKTQYSTTPTNSTATKTMEIDFVWNSPPKKKNYWILLVIVFEFWYFIETMSACIDISFQNKLKCSFLKLALMHNIRCVKMCKLMHAEFQDGRYNMKTDGTISTIKPQISSKNLEWKNCDVYFELVRVYLCIKGYSPLRSNLNTVL